MPSAFLSPVFDVLVRLSDAIYMMANSICGRSRALDTLLALPVNNQLVKAAVVGGCLLAAWHVAKDEAALLRSRRIILLTLVAAVLVVAVTKSVSKSVFLPRPFIQSQKAFHLEGGRLVESPRLAYRVPLDDESQSDYRKLLEGNILANHLGSFPSDHAGFYATLAAGTWLASRQLGTVALVWTFVVILGTRIVNGMHSPLDIAAGAGLGIGVLLACQWTLGTWVKGPLDAVTRWTLRHPAFSSVVMFIVAFESANTLDNLRPLLKTALNLGKWMIGG